MPPLWDMVKKREILEFTSLLSGKWPELKSRKQRHGIQESALKRMRRHWDKRGARRILKKTVKTRQGKTVILKSEQCPKHLSDLLISFVKHPEKFQGPKNILKNSRHTLCLKINTESTKYFLKAYRSSSNLKSISYLFKTPRVLRAWHTSRNLLLRHISTPLPLVAIHTGNPWKSIYGAMLSPWIEAGDSNTILIKKILKQRKQGDRLIKDLAYFLWQMHEKGIFHGDCKITNFRFNPADKNRFTVFDLDSTRIRSAIKDRDRISDITDMCASMEMWRIREHITHDFLIHYIRLHIPWEKESTILLKNLRKRVETRLKRKRNAC
jgi:tRNA A-37 threonylcarbamoyl transferase component Bud32